jgi:NADPH:quinone reductase-like Zn-dependent oxidoreductase
MKAAVVSSFAEPPRYEDFAAPTPALGETLVRVKAAALSQLVKSQASGKHYSSTEGGFPFIPGVDGVGELVDGRRVYFAFPTAPYGAMAETTVVKEAYCIPVPDGVSDVTAAAIGNPGMSSWAALTERAKFVAGETVLINGATGTSGRLAVQIAKHLGAARVIATGRNAASIEGLAEIGADVLVPLDDTPESLANTFRETIRTNRVNVILDYLWGASAQSIFAALSGHGSGEAEPRIRYVQIGSITGNTVTLPSSALRSSGLELLGSGLGSVSNEGLLRSIGGVLNAVVAGRLTIDALAVPLADVHAGWNSADSGRIVFTL